MNTPSDKTPPYRFEISLDPELGYKIVEAVSQDPFEPIHSEPAIDGDVQAATQRLRGRLSALSSANDSCCSA